MAKPSGNPRPYDPGEDAAACKQGLILCQTEAVRYARPGAGICGMEVTKVGRFNFAGGWHDVYTCPKGHRFGIRQKASGEWVVVDVATEKPVFGQR